MLIAATRTRSTTATRRERGRPGAAGAGGEGGIRRGLDEAGSAETLAISANTRVTCGCVTKSLPLVGAHLRESRRASCTPSSPPQVREGSVGELCWALPGLCGHWRCHDHGEALSALIAMARPPRRALGVYERTPASQQRETTSAVCIEASEAAGGCENGSGEPSRALATCGRLRLPPSLGLCERHTCSTRCQIGAPTEG